MKILVANRGEIAVRIIRACREMDIRTVAVYSEADRAALHVLYADESLPIGPAPSSESYLRIDRVLDAAKRTHCDAVHPGYGFLAENAAFARACEEAGIIFIGPSADAIDAMGSKTESRRRMRAAGVPIVPGLEKPVADYAELEAAANDVGFPVMIKASAGGGGKGLRRVDRIEDLRSAYERVQSEAKSFFGDASLYLEKMIVAPRHIEVQILGDQHGNVIHLGERECTLQRRHQKVIEEAPSPVVDEELRGRLGEAAIRAARAVNYYSAGTIEMLMGQDKEFYFLEMNTRLQVEHPVTEMVTGVDIVKEQIRIASGEPLSMTQADVKLRGHAIECRIYAEDPFRNFAPSPGRITHLNLPHGPGVRNDNGVYTGFAVPIHYDPMLSKLIVSASNRHEAILRMKRALREYRVEGIDTSVPFYSALMDDPDFLTANFDTGFIDAYLANATFEPPAGGERERAAIITAAILAFEAAQKALPIEEGCSRWRDAARAEGMSGPRR